MDKKQKENLNGILSDKLSGSSEILYSLNNFFLSIVNNKTAIKVTISLAKKRLSRFATIKNYLTALEKLVKDSDDKKIKDYLEQSGKKEDIIAKKIFEKLHKKIPDAKSILTFSKSGTILSILKLWKKKNPSSSIIITESRPEYEGRLMAKELLKSGLKVNVITDAMAGIFVKKIDAVIIGADAVLRNRNVINKTGSLSLALLCKHYKKPIYVLTAKSKFLKTNTYNLISEVSTKIWNYKHPKLKTANIPFEEIDKKLITEIISE